MYGVDYERRGEDELVARWGGDDGDGIGRLAVSARSNGFAGRGLAWFDRQAVAEFARDLARFPLPATEPPTLSSGFGAPGQFESNEYDEFVGISVVPLGSLGQLDVRIHLADDERSGHFCPEGRYETRMHLLTTYERLGTFAQDLQALVEGKLEVAVLGGERLN